MCGPAPKQPPGLVRLCHATASKMNIHLHSDNARYSLYRSVRRIRRSISGKHPSETIRSSVRQLGVNSILLTGADIEVHLETSDSECCLERTHSSIRDMLPRGFSLLVNRSSKIRSFGNGESAHERRILQRGVLHICFQPVRCISGGYLRSCALQGYAARSTGSGVAVLIPIAPLYF